MKFLLPLFICLPLFGVNLLNYNVYDRQDRVDIMLSFDAAYSGNITQDIKQGIVLINLDGVNSKKEETRELNSNLVKKILLSPQKNKTSIMLETKESVDINFANINNKIGLRIRIIPKGANLTSSTPLNLINEANTTVATKNSSLDGVDLTNYMIVLFILLAILIALWWFKKYYLLKGTPNFAGFKVIFQRPLDRSNQFIVLEYENKRYTMIIGNSNLILEKEELAEESTTQKKEPKERSFDAFFEENKKRLQNLLNKKTN